MTKFQVKGHTIKVPASWNELTAKQLLRIAEISMNQHNAVEFRVLVLLALTGWKLLLPKDGNQRFRVGRLSTISLNEVQISQLLTKLDFLTKEIETKNGMVETIYPALTENKIPSIFVFKPLHGPTSNFVNLRFGEWIVADNYFNLYYKTSNQEWLDKLIATIYRPMTDDLNIADSDIRAEFNSHTVAKRAKRIAKLPAEKKTAILFFYQGCKRDLVKRFPAVFSQKGGKASKYGALSLVNALAGDDVTRVETVRQQYLYDVMIHMEEAIVNNEKMMERMKKK